jgi:hypothetical protein
MSHFYAYLAKMKFGDFNTWPEVDMDPYKLPRGTQKLVNVAYMTYASEFFSWYAGSVQADTYFCPERHGTYFGGFYMKDMPAMGKKDFNISTSVTGDSGQSFLDTLTADQRAFVTSIVPKERKALLGRKAGVLVPVGRAVHQLVPFANGLAGGVPNLVKGILVRRLETPVVIDKLPRLVTHDRVPGDDCAAGESGQQQETDQHGNFFHDDTSFFVDLFPSSMIRRNG